MINSSVREDLESNAALRAGDKNRNRVLLQCSQDVFLNSAAGAEGQSLNPDCSD